MAYRRRRNAPLRRSSAAVLRAILRAHGYGCNPARRRRRSRRFNPWSITAGSRLPRLRSYRKARRTYGRVHKRRFTKKARAAAMRNLRKARRALHRPVRRVYRRRAVRARRTVRRTHKRRFSRKARAAAMRNLKKARAAKTHRSYNREFSRDMMAKYAMGNNPRRRGKKRRLSKKARAACMRNLKKARRALCRRR